MSFTDKFKFIKTSCVENKCPTITALTAIDTKILEKYGWPTITVMTAGNGNRIHCDPER